MTATGTPAADLRASAERVRQAAIEQLRAATTDVAARLRTSRPGYSYRYADRIAGAAVATKPTRRGEVATASVKVGGRAAAFTGGASITDLVMGAEFGATTGDVVRVTTSTGASRTVAAQHFTSHAARTQSQYSRIITTKRGKQRRVRATAATAGAQRTRITAVRRGGLAQFPTRRRDGWFLTPTLDGYESQLWSDTDAAFVRALDGG